MEVLHLQHLIFNKVSDSIFDAAVILEIHIFWLYLYVITPWIKSVTHAPTQRSKMQVSLYSMILMTEEELMHTQPKRGDRI